MRDILYTIIAPVAVLDTNPAQFTGYWYECDEWLDELDTNYDPDLVTIREANADEYINEL